MERVLKTFKCFDRPIELGRDAVLPLVQARGALVRSLHGTLWVTQEGDREDYFVRAGESFSIEHDGVTLVSAPQGAGTVLVTLPAARPRPRRDRALAGVATRIPAADRESIMSRPHSEPAGLTYADVVRDSLLMERLIRQARRAQAAAFAEMFAAVLRAFGSGLRRVAGALAPGMQRRVNAAPVQGLMHK